MNLSLESDPWPMRDSRKNPDLSYLRILPQGTLQLRTVMESANCSALAMTAPAEAQSHARQRQQEDRQRLRRFRNRTDGAGKHRGVCGVLVSDAGDGPGTGVIHHHAHPAVIVRSAFRNLEFEPHQPSYSDLVLICIRPDMRGRTALAEGKVGRR